MRSCNPTASVVAVMALGLFLLLPCGGARAFAIDSFAIDSTDMSDAMDRGDLPAPAPQSAALQWFPDPGDRELSLTPPPVRLAGDAPSAVVVKEQAVIPLPPAAWTGMAALSVIAVVGKLKNFRRLI